MSASTASGDAVSHEEFLHRSQFELLDGLRCLAILAVLWHHVGRFSRPIEGRGHLGVDLFFVISGFLIPTLLLREQAKTGTIDLRGFYIRRTLRIFPSYFMLLLISGFLFGFVLRASPLREEFFKSIPALLFYATNFFPVGALLHHTWSLSAEEQFYLSYPGAAKLFPRTIALGALAALGILQVRSFFFREVVESAVPTLLGAYKCMDVSFSPILVGVLLAHALRSKAAYARLKPLLAARWAPLLAAGLFVACAAPAGELFGWRRLGVLLSFALLVGGCVINEANIGSALFKNAAARRIGKISYGMYLYHMFGMHAGTVSVRKMGASPELLFPLTVVFTYLIAEASYRAYESRFLELKKRFA